MAALDLLLHRCLDMLTGYRRPNMGRLMDLRIG